MRRVLCLFYLLSLFVTAAGCGASSDAPPPTMTPELQAKKREEAKKAMEEGMKKKDETYKKPGG